MKYEHFTEEDLTHFADMGKDELTIQEEFINQMSVADILESIGEMGYIAKAKLRQAVIDQDDLEVGSVVMGAIRGYAEENCG